MRPASSISLAVLALFAASGVAFADPPKAVGEGEGEVDIVAWPGYIERGETDKLSGFGVFCLRDKNSRPGRNPKTGELIPVSARRVVMFHPSHILKALVQKEQPVATLAVSSREPAARERIEAEALSPG